MLLLSKEKQATIDYQIYNKSRDIDATLFGALSGSLPKDYLLDCLMFYQASDGGFASGLHIDNYNTATSVYQIYEAYRLLDMLEFDSSCDHELYSILVNKSGNYLFNREAPKDNRWNANTKSNNGFAHAQLFEYCEENTKLLGYHPTAAIVGYTLVLQKESKAYYKKAMKMAQVLINEFYEKSELSKYEFISFNSFLNSIKKKNLFVEEQEKIEKHLIEMAKKQVTLDFNDSNAILPLDAAMYVNDPELSEKIDLQLDYIINSIKPHGLWENEADWGNNNKYAEEDSAKLKWLGAATVNNYFILKKYGRLE